MQTHSIHAAGGEHAHSVWDTSIEPVRDLRIHEVVDAPNWVVGCFVPDTLL